MPEIRTLKKRSQFLRIKASGASIATASLVLQASESKEKFNYINIGYTATKTLGNAVVRNRIKRRLKAAAKEIIGNNTKMIGRDFVIIGRKSALDRDFIAIKKDLTYAMHNVGVASEHPQRNPNSTNNP